MTDLTVRELKQADWGEWDQWLTSQPWCSPFSSAWWLDTTCRAFGGRPLLLGVFRGDRLAGGVALRITDMAFLHVVRRRCSTTPLFWEQQVPEPDRRCLLLSLRTSRAETSSCAL